MTNFMKNINIPFFKSSLSLPPMISYCGLRNVNMMLLNFPLQVTGFDKCNVTGSETYLVLKSGKKRLPRLPSLVVILLVRHI